MSGQLFALATQTAWAIQPEALQMILEVISGEHRDLEAVAAKRATRMDGADMARVRDGVAIIPVLGPITRRASLFSDVSGMSSVDAIARDFNAALNDPAVNSIMLEIDSPGGEVTGINELSAMIASARGKKPIVAYVGGLGASAAYWLASAADEIVTTETAALGSIGVVATVPNPAAKKLADLQFVSSQSPKKRPDLTTEGGKSQLQAHVDDLAQVFVDTVAAHRGVTSEKVLEDFGQGGIIVGRKAVDAGLADRLGSFESTISELAAGKVMRRRKPMMAASLSAVADANMADEKGLKERILAALGMTATAEDKTDTSASEEKAKYEAEIAARIEASNQEIKEKYAAEYAARIKVESEAFAMAALASGKLLPANKAAFVEDYIERASDDLALPVASGQPSRVDRLKARIEATTPHAMFEEKIADKGAQSLREKTDAKGEVTPEREAALMNLTSVGQAALKAVK